MNADVLQFREGERISGDGDFGVTLLADIEQMGVVSVQTEPGGNTPPLHVHERHAECFFVLEGELTFTLEDHELRAEAGTWVFVPRQVVHTVSVTGDTRAHFLDLHAPSCGFGALVRGLQPGTSEQEIRAVRAAFDQKEAPESGADPGLVVVRRTGGVEGETITDRPGRRATLLVDAEELTVSEFLYGPGERGAKPHVHHHHVDAFLVVEGELTVIVGNGSFRAPGGTLVVLPPGVVHGFDNDGSETMRVYNFHVPASGFADYLRGRNPDFDQHDPPEDGGADPASVVAVRLSETG
jgi:quercetin dioxygenase-like cupin family protein